MSQRTSVQKGVCFAPTFEFESTRGQCPRISRLPFNFPQRILLVSVESGLIKL